MSPRAPEGGLVAAAIAGAAALSCGGAGVPADLAAESPHFRLFVGSAVTPAVDAQDELIRLETNWADTATLLAMPEGRIDYVLLPPDQIPAACGIADAVGCEVDRTVYTSAFVDQHELNHAYLELRTTHRPHPLLAEGIAEAVGCGEGAEPPPTFDQAGDWRDLIAGASYGALYGPGRQLTRYLLLAAGPARFLDYYQQAPRTNDPAAFSANFARFWSIDLDVVWSAMQAAQPAWGPQEVLPLCPCALPSWSASTVPTPLPQLPAHPYWTWPSPQGATAVLAGYQGSFAVHDCARRDLQEFASVTLMFARLQGSFYASADSPVTIASGSYLSDSCADTLPYPLPAAVLANSGGSPLSMAVQRPAESPLSTYLALTPPGPIQLGIYDGHGQVVVCPDCQTPDSECQPVPDYPSSLPVSGPFTLHWTDRPQAATAGWPYTFITLWVSAAP